MVFKKAEPAKTKKDEKIVEPKKNITDSGYKDTIKPKIDSKKETTKEVFIPIYLRKTESTGSNKPNLINVRNRWDKKVIIIDANKEKDFKTKYLHISWNEFIK